MTRRGARGNRAAIVARYRDRVRNFEVYNEPNNWVGPSDPKLAPGDFAALLCDAVYRAARCPAGSARSPFDQVGMHFYVGEEPDATCR